MGRGWHILERAVERGQRAKRPARRPTLGVDEKALAKGHQYLTLICDLDRATVEFFAEPDRDLLASTSIDRTAS